ncbi:hypothetical protein JCM8547_002169 [Rhodosporidiobolus lusitaniae]
MELRTASANYRSLPGEACGVEEDARSSGGASCRGISGSLEALRATRSGKPTEWMAIRYPTRHDFERLWASIKDLSSRTRRRDKDPLARAVSLVLYVVGVLGLVALCIGGVVGYLKYRSLFHPHHAKHASKADLKSGNVVKPFFSPKSADGLVEHLNVGVSIWFREGNTTTPSNEELHRVHHAEQWYSYEWHDDAAQETQVVQDDEGVPNNSNFSLYKHLQRSYWMEENSRVDGEDGYVRNETRQNPWERVWTAEVATSGLAYETRRSLNVTIPGKVIHSLVVNPLSRLVATFNVYPRNLDSLDFASSRLSHVSSRPVDKYGPDKPWPIAHVPIAPRAAPELASFLAHAGAGYEIKRWRQTRWVGRWDHPDRRENAIFSRTWVTMADDYPVYEQSSFRSALEALQREKKYCAQLNWRRSDCRRSFSQDGHFENLLKVEDGEQYYGPFITTRMTTTTTSDYHFLPPYTVMKSTKPELVDDLDYTWTFAFSAISPAKLALTNHLDDDSNNLFDSQWSERETAHQHDNLEFYNALIGHSFNPNAHPIARTVIGGFAVLLRWLTVPLVFHYWFTRRSTAGIVLVWWFAQTVSDIVFHIVHSLTNQHYFIPLLFILRLFSFILLGLVQLRLLTGIEVRFTNLLPAAVRLRGFNPSERKSAELDRRFDWRLRIGAFLILFLSLRLTPAIPPLIRATLNTTEDPLIRLYWNDDQSPLALRWLRNLSSWSSAMWLVTRVSQIHLNFRHGTFAASHPLTSYLLLASLILSHLTTIFGSFFGRAQSQGPLTAWDVVSLLVEATLAAQARNFPVVGQREKEEILG